MVQDTAQPQREEGFIAHTSTFCRIYIIKETFKTHESWHFLLYFMGILWKHSSMSSFISIFKLITASAGILEQSMGARNPSRNRVVAPARQAAQAGGIDFLESISGLLNSLKILSQDAGARETHKDTTCTSICFV
jgi:hypothetical protein